MSNLPAGRLAAVLFLLGLLSGCEGSNRSSIDGSVTLDGQPLQSGSIAFVPIEGTQGPSAGANISGGRYSVTADKGPFSGTYRVEIHAQRKTGRKVEVGSTLGRVTGMVDEMEEAIPAEYNDDSTLRAKVEAGTNTLDFKLESPGK